MVVPKGSSTDGGINIHVVKKDTIPPYANPVIFEQVHSPHIYVYGELVLLKLVIHQMKLRPLCKL